ncbi:MAG: hypothetical protein V4691_10700 [Pseudomonadota bacterium]
MLKDISANPAALRGHSYFVMAHPGHELRLFGWLQNVHPTVSILTKGSRSGFCGRVDASAKVVEECGAKRGKMFGAIYDRDFYQFVLGNDIQPFHDWIDALRDEFIDASPELVVADSWQTYNVAHDLLHVMARVALAEAGRRTGKASQFYDYAVVPDQLVPNIAHSKKDLSITLDAQLLQKKIHTAKIYPDIGEELEEIASLEGIEALAHETLCVPPPLEMLLAEPATQPLYEVYGEQRVASGTYGDVIRWSHVAPIARQLAARLQAVPVKVYA